MIRIYLAGPITGCTDGEANDWRSELIQRLSYYNIAGISPLRCEPLHGERYGETSEDPRFGTPQAIQSKNFMDVQKCDLTLAYFPKQQTADYGISIGTLLEVGWAKGLGKPTIVVSEHSKADHAVLRASASWHLHSLDEAFETIVGLFADYIERGRTYERSA